MDDLRNATSILAALLVAVPAILARVHVGTWTCPAALFSLFWIAYVWIPMLLLPDAHVPASAVVYIASAVFAFSAPVFFIGWRKVWTDADHQSSLACYRRRELDLAFWVIVTVSILGFLLDVRSQGFDLLAALASPISTSSQFISMRYAGELQSSFFLSISTVSSYAAATLGGLVVYNQRKFLAGAAVVAGAMAPGVMTLLLTGAKGNIFLILALFFGGVLLQKIARRERGLLTRREFLRLATIGAVLLPAVVSSFVARGYSGESDASTLARQVRYGLASYSAGHLYAFGDWFDETQVSVGNKIYHDNDEPTFGFYTFTAVFRAAGDDRYVPHGVYEEYFTRFGIKTNIYTLYRGLIVDFGVAGSLLLLFALGSMAMVVHRLLLAGRGGALSAALYSQAMGFYYTSFIVSIFIWNSIFASFVLVTAMLWLAQAASARSSKSPARAARVQ